MEILLDSPIVLIILIGLISSFFKRIKENGANVQNPRPVSRPANTSGNQMPGERSDAGKQTNIQQVYQETKQHAVKAPEVAVSRGRRQGVEPNPQLAAQSSERSNDFQPSRNSLVEGIIWSEVLGPPRSKKPYRSGRRN